MKKIILFALMSISAIVFSQGTGIVKGLLLDKEMSNQPLPFANVTVKGTSVGVNTEMDGTYSFDVPVGKQTIVFSFVGYKSIEKIVDVVKGNVIVLNETLGSSGGEQLKTIVIKAVSTKEKKTALLIEQKKATVIKESIGAVELKEKGVSNAASATTKIVGVSKTEGSGAVYIRGLGDRYLSTTMNGLPIPSDDVENKNIDLGLFSTNVIQNVSISKTYATNSYADQGSGTVDVVSKIYSKNKISFGFSGGVNTNVLGVNQFRKTIVANDAKFGFYNPNMNLMQAITKQGWDPVNTTMPFNYGGSFGINHKIGNLSLVTSLAYSNSNEYRKGMFRNFKRNDIKSYFNTERFINSMNLTGYARLGYKFNSNNKISFNTLFVNKAKDVLYEQGRDGKAYVRNQDPAEFGAFVRDQNFMQTTLSVNQLMGEHKLNDNNTLTWAGGFNIVQSGEPNRIRNEVNIIDTPKIKYATVGDFQQRKSSQEIYDTDINTFFKNKWELALGGGGEDKSYALNYGVNFRAKERSFNSLFIGVKAQGVEAPSVDELSSTFTEENFVDVLQLRRRPFDFYNANLLAYAAFVNFDFKFDYKLSGNLGLRFERDELNVYWDVANYLNEFTSEARKDDLSKVYHSIYPSINLKYAINKRQFLRFASSVTQTLPEFKELAPFEYVSPTGRVSKGNPNLEKSDVYNLDLKWEFFPTKSELMSATIFYKQIKNPINLALTRGSSGNFYYANTGLKADVLGLELEAKLALLKNEDKKSVLSTTGNITLMSLKQDLFKEFQYKDVTSTKLQGAANLILNGSVNYNSQTKNPLIATLTANYSSDKILALGGATDQAQRAVEYNDEIIQKGFVSFDAVVSKKINKFMTAKLVGKNLLNPEIKQTQLVKSIVTQNEIEEPVFSYRKGVQLSLNLSFNF